MKKFNTCQLPAQPIRHFFVMVLLVLCAGCSSVRLTYDHGETLLAWWIDSYTDLDTEQKGRLRKDIDHLFEWHRQTQLRDYAQLLAGGQRRLQGQPTQADLLADYRDVRARFETLLYQAQPELADLARTLRPEQIAYMEKKFAANNDDYRKKYLSGELAQRQKQRYQKSLDEFERWFGNFSNEQEDSIRRSSDARPLDHEFWLDEQIRRQTNIVNLVKKVQRDKLDRDATMLLVHKLIRDSFERLDHSERKPMFDAYTDATARMVLNVIRIATPTQKAHAMRRLRGWIDDCALLAAKAG
jgi:hypothetical protein